MVVWAHEVNPSKTAKPKTAATMRRRIHREYVGAAPDLWLPPKAGSRRSKVPVASLIVFDGAPHLLYRCLNLGLQPFLRGQISSYDWLPIAEPAVDSPARDADGKQNHEDRRYGRRLHV